MSARTYTEEEKIAYVEDFKKSNQPQTVYARENAIPESTFRAWLKEDRSLTFGAIEAQKTLLNTDKMKFQWPKDRTEIGNITREQLHWLLSGLKMYPKKYFKDINITEDAIAS